MAVEIFEQHGLIVPDYQNTVANIPATIAHLLGVQLPGLPPLPTELWQPLLEKHEVRRVVLLLVDGMGCNLINSLAHETAWLAQEATFSGTITSVFPSTTVNALSCLWTGAGPAQHGLVGLELFFPELGVMGQMLALTPSFAWWPDGLTNAGVEPTTFLPVPSIAELLAAGSVDTYAVKHSRLVNTTLSKMHGRGVKEGYGIETAADLMWRVGEILDDQKDQKLFISAYWSAIDTLSHRHSYDHPAVAAELHSFLYLFKHGLLERLSAEAHRGTLVILTADHGQTKVPLEKSIFIEDHPQLQAHLLMRAAGEPHAAYLYVRDGHKQAVIDYVEQYLGHAAIALDSQAALKSGLFGPPPYAHDVVRRIGDVILTTRNGYSLLSRQGDPIFNELVGRHGGLTPDEMEVPLYGFYFS